MTESGLLFDVLFLLLAAVVLVPVLQRFGIPSVLGYLAAGVMLGPHTPGPVVDAATTRSHRRHSRDGGSQPADGRPGDARRRHCR